MSKIPVSAVLMPVNLKEKACCLGYSVPNSICNMYKCRITIRGLF